MSEEISEYDKLILEPVEQEAVTPPDDKSAIVETPAGEKSPEADAVPNAGNTSQSDIESSELRIETPDGKRTIPFKVLDDANKARIEAETKLQDLVTKLENFQNGQGVATPVISQEALDKLAELREYDTESADIFEKTLQDLAATAQRAVQLEQKELAKQQQDEAQAQAQQQAIIESYPNLKAMQQNPETWEQAGKVWDAFYANPATAQLSDADKIAKLNDVMTAMLGAPAQPQQHIVTPPAAPQPKVITPQVAQVYSLSDLPSGAIPSAATGHKPIEEMSSFELQELWNKYDYNDLPAVLSGGL